MKISHLVLGGGGVKGISMLGVIKYLEKNNLMNNIKSLTGTSSGAILCTFLNIGYNYHEIYSILSIFSSDLISNIKIDNFWGNFGIDEMNDVVKLLEIIFKDKSIDPTITFYQLFKLTTIKLTITTVCLGEGLLYLNYINNPDLPVIKGLQMSMCIPFLYKPVLYKGKYYIDGGLLDNFPINVNKSNKEVLGVKISNKKYNIGDGIIEYMLSIMDTVIAENDKKHFEKFKNKILEIPVDNLGTFQFDLTSKQKKELVNIGYNATLNFIKKNV